MKNVTMVVIALLALSGCSKKAGGDSAGTAMAKMTAFKNEMCACKDAKCAHDVSDKMTKWMQEQGKSGARQPSGQHTKEAAELGEAIGKCMQSAISADAAGSADSAGSAAGSAAETAVAGSAGSAAGATGLPAECDDYRAQVEKLKTCDKLPEKAKEALVNAYDDASAGWAALPEAAKAGLGTSCKRGTEALVAAAKDACGW